MCSGGDGIYLNTVTNAVIRNVTTHGAYRNGLSVIGARKLLVENCTFANTGNVGLYNGGDKLTPSNGGTAPRAGLCLMSSYPNIVLFPG